MTSFFLWCWFLLSGLARADAPACGVGFGFAAGTVDVRSYWEWAERGPFMPNGSPVFGAFCLPEAGRLTLITAAQIAPWYIHFRIDESRIVRQWVTSTLGVGVSAGKMTLGPIATLGNNAVGFGLYVRRPVGKRGQALDLRLNNYPTDPIRNVQLQVLYTFQAREPKEPSR
ncbi:MAG: hypothetical protein AAFV53_16935 [Myxococcota bacterium]